MAKPEDLAHPKRGFTAGPVSMGTSMSTTQERYDPEERCDDHHSHPPAHESAGAHVPSPRHPFPWKTRWVIAARWAASSMNEQPWRYILVRRDNWETFNEALECLVPANRPVGLQGLRHRLCW